MTKQGTPTMGGLMFIIGIGITAVIVGWKGMVQGDFTHIYVYLFALVFGVIGYIDDYQNVKHHRNTGLTAIQKFLLQLAAAVAFLCLLRAEGHLSPNLYIPFFNTYVVLNWVVYMILGRLYHRGYGERREHHRWIGRPVHQRYHPGGGVLRGAGRGVEGLSPVGHFRRRHGRRPAGIPAV